MANLPAPWDLEIYQTTTPYAWQITFLAGGTPVNLTGYSAVFTCRPSLGDPTVLFQLSTGAGGVVLGGSAGTITVAFPVSQPLTGAYDLVLYDASDNEFPLLAGDFSVQQAVTR